MTTCTCGNDKYFLVSIPIEQQSINGRPILYPQINKPSGYSLECLECHTTFECTEIDEIVLKNAKILSQYGWGKLYDEDYYKAVKEIEFLD